jgi:hypothetical protein
VKKGATLTSLYHACSDHNARLPDFLQEVFFGAMLQRALDKCMCFSKAVNFFVKYLEFVDLSTINFDSSSNKYDGSSGTNNCLFRKDFLHLCIY